MSIALLPGIGITSEICLLTATLTDKRLTHCYQTIRQIAKKGRKVRSQMAHRGIYSARACSVSKSHNEYIDIKCNARDLMRLYQSLGGEVPIPPC